VGVVRFNVWMTPVMPRLDDAMVEFQRCRGVVLDLRGNVGGVAAMVMGLGGYFVDSTVSLGTMTTRGGALRYVSNPRRSDRHGRALRPFAGSLAILVDGMSVSTSEIFAAEGIRTDLRSVVQCRGDAGAGAGTRLRRADGGAGAPGHAGAASQRRRNAARGG
jgi:carboxyl-terminal processing protease